MTIELNKQEEEDEQDEPLTISELIEKLEEVKEAMGDLFVSVDGTGAGRAGGDGAHWVEILHDDLGEPFVEIS